jgi:hypothetical protein
LRFIDSCYRQTSGPRRFGLNRNRNHDLKNLFKSAATVATAKPGPFQEFCDARVAQRMRPEMARLTLASKIAAITSIVWKKGVHFDVKHLKPQTARVSRAHGTEDKNNPAQWGGLDGKKNSGQRLSVFSLTPFMELTRTQPPSPTDNFLFANDTP